MGEPTEREVLGRLAENFRLAAQNCELLAVTPKRGKIYIALREQLRVIEDMARVVGHWRGGDARWLQIGLKAAECHKRAGDWLRGIKQPGGGYRPLTEGQKHPLFLKLAEVLRAGQKNSEGLRDKKTGRRGPILPIVRPLPYHQDRNFSGWSQTPSGLVIPV